MERAITEKNYSSLNEYLHALKGSSGSIGAIKLHNLCHANMDEIAADSFYIRLIKEISQTFIETKSALNTYIESTYKAKIPL
jgi:HPt (histidine-containing phosphotransfer) domain-containing protein